MVIKSYAKINLSLNVNRKLKNGLHNIQSIYCLVNLYDTISLKKNNLKKDEIRFYGPYAKHINRSNNTVSKILQNLRKFKLTSNFYSVKIKKKIPVFSGLGGGSSNAASIFKFLVKKKIEKKKFNKLIENVGSDLILFFNKQGYQKDLNTVVDINNYHKLNFLLVYPNIKSSTKKVFSKVKKYSKRENLSINLLKFKKDLIDHLLFSKNDLQSIVEKKYPLIKKLLIDINNSKGCNFSRMTGSGSVCFGLFANESCSKVALKKLRKKYNKFSFSIANTI